MALLIACDWRECTATVNPDHVTDRWIRVEFLSTVHRMHDEKELHFCSDAHVIAYYEDRTRRHLT